MRLHKGGMIIINKDKLKGFMALNILVTLAGLFLLFNSVNLGTSLAENWLLSQEGADTSFYEIRIKESIHNFLAAGSVFLAVGLTTTMFTYYKILTMKDEQVNERIIDDENE